MKKYIFIAILFLFAFTAHAATVDDSIALQTQYQNALVQLISLLEQQLLSLETQLATIQSTQDTVATQVQSVTTQVAQVVQNTTPAPVITPDPIDNTIHYPAAPTCTMIGYLELESDGNAYDYLNMKYNSSDPDVVKYPTVNGVSITKGLGDGQILTATTTFTGVVTDIYGQTGSCSVTLTPSMSTCAEGNWDGSCTAVEVSSSN